MILVFVLTQNELINDSEAAFFGAEAPEYHCSVCDLGHTTGSATGKQ